MTFSGCCPSYIYHHGCGDFGSASEAASSVLQLWKLASPAVFGDVTVCDRTTSRHKRLKS